MPEFDYYFSFHDSDYINNLEHLYFKERVHEPALPKQNVISILKHYTVLEDLLADEHPGYISDLVNRTYTSHVWNEYNIKRFIILHYPHIILETVLNKQTIPLLRSIKVGLVPKSKEPEKINAVALRLNGNQSGIIFSEGLFTYLWDFHNISNPSHTISLIAPSDSTEGLDEASIKKLLRAKLKTGYYSALSFADQPDYGAYLNSFKISFLSSLLFAHAHELGHIIHHHSDNAKDKTGFRYSIRDGAFVIENFSRRQEMEFEADLFASDVYFHFLYNSLRLADEDAFRFLHKSPFDLLREIAYAEGEEDWDSGTFTTHPPSGYRLIYIILRHKEKFIKAGLAEYVKHPERAYAQEVFVKYNYAIDLNSAAYLRG